MLIMLKWALIPVFSIYGGGGMGGPDGGGGYGGCPDFRYVMQNFALIRNSVSGILFVIRYSVSGILFVIR